jgi:hypothetical protein
MSTILIAKSTEEAQAARCKPDIVLCPQDPSIKGAEWFPTALFIGALFKPCGEWIPEAHDRKTRHVARIQTLALALGLERSADEPLLILSADVTPPSGWEKRLKDGLTDKIGMVAGVVPTGYGEGVKAWHIDGNLATTQDNFGVTPLGVQCAALDCCAVSVAAARAIGSLTGDDLTEMEIGRKLALAGLSITINPLVQCLHG